jgi:hypothetical protein
VRGGRVVFVRVAGPRGQGRFGQRRRGWQSRAQPERAGFERERTRRAPAFGYLAAASIARAVSATRSRVTASIAVTSRRSGPPTAASLAGADLRRRRGADDLDSGKPTRTA